MFIATDESGLAPRFEAIGSIWLSNSALVEFERAVTEWRITNHFWQEIHFDEIDERTNDFTISNYLRFLEIAFASGAEFKAMVVPTELTNLALHEGNPRIRELNFLALLVSFKLSSDFPDTTEEISIVSDSFIQGSPVVTREETTATVNPEGGMVFETQTRTYKAIPRAKERIEVAIGKKIACFAQCTSHICSAVQLADLFAGAVASRLRGEVLNANRERIVSSFESHFDHPFGTRTISARRDLNIWIWRPKLSQ